MVDGATVSSGASSRRRSPTGEVGNVVMVVVPGTRVPRVGSLRTDVEVLDDGEVIGGASLKESGGAGSSVSWM